MKNHFKSSQPSISFILASMLFIFGMFSHAQIIPVGEGSYTTQFPGTDVAGRNTYPSGTPFTTGPAATKPVPTNDWWSAKVKNSHADNLFNYPFTLKTVNSGLVVTYIPWGVIDDIQPVTVGVSGLNASAANIYDFSDWTIEMEWSNAEHLFHTTTGIGMPFLYFTKNSGDVAQVTVTSGSVVVDNEMMVITDVRNGADFAVYAPLGSVWTQNGNVYTSDLNGQNYWSLAFIPLDAGNVTTVANEYKKYAYVFPTNTTADYNYNAATAVMRTDFVVETEVKEGDDTNMLLGLLPHQWAHLAEDSPYPNEYSYQTIRGELKTLEGNQFSVENTFHGILPTLPYIDYYSEDFNPMKLNEKVQLLENEGLSTWTDSYNEGQVMNRLIQTARIADLMGNTNSRDLILETIKERLEDWLEANSGEVAFLFYYNETWTSMIGYPAGHGQDGNLNDHHFHWGYFIHAASFVEQFDPGWAEQWGGMIDLLIRDAASPDRSDDMFPYLRNFSPYAGHCWANGFATFPQGNDQESTSESMQFNSSLIHWGAITGNDDIRDLGIYLYTTEQSAIEEYWFDIHDRILAPDHPYSLVSRVWGNSYDNGTFWTNDIAASYGIELYPIHGGSLYLGHHIEYATQLWAEIAENTGILINEANDNLWHDVMWEYLAFTDPELALELYDSYPDRSLKFGISDAQTYHWLHAMNVLGEVDATITSDYPTAAVFNKDGESIYVAHNYKDEDINVAFSDGFVLEVPANTMVTSLDVDVSGILEASFDAAYVGGSVDLILNISQGNPDKIAFYDGEEFLGEQTQPPYEMEVENLYGGRHHFYARIYDGDLFNVSNLVSIVVGEQIPFEGDAIAIPGSFQAAFYDKYEGGLGQGIAYTDVSPGNNGDFRMDEYVDATMDANEGGTVGWIASGEWLEYTIDVEEAGYYSMNFRYACGNQSGGGPFQMESDEQIIKSDISVNYTGDWDAWTSQTVENIPLKSGQQILRLYFQNGELNIGNMTFTYESALDFDQPVADAGENILVVLPETTTTLDGSNSSDPEGATLSFEWTQIYGPSTLVFSDQQAVQPVISGLTEGVYKVKLVVDNGSYADQDEMYIISSNSTNFPPTVSLVSPADQDQFLQGDLVNIVASAADLVGYVEYVEFYVNNSLIGSSAASPYEISWQSIIGNHQIKAIAYDNDGDTGTSQIIEIIVNSAPPCYGTSYNGEFDYEFSPDDNNPTLTFIPSIQGMGEPTCILYYGTNANSLPGYYVTPNVPYQLTASEGTQIYFYYTYSYPGQGEHNNADHKDTYVIGSCNVVSVNDIDAWEVNYYPNPVTDQLFLELPEGKKTITVYSITGQLLDSFEVSSNQYSYDMSRFDSGLYVFSVMNNDHQKVFKITK
jgi:endoglucanase Acf2